MRGRARVCVQSCVAVGVLGAYIYDIAVWAKGDPQTWDAMRSDSEVTHNLDRVFRVGVSLLSLSLGVGLH